MALEHISKGVWWCLAFLIFSLAIFVLTFTCMFKKTKSFEIKLNQLDILVKYADNYANQLDEINKSMLATVSQLKMQSDTPISPSVNQQKNNENSSIQHSVVSVVSSVPNSTELMLQVKKQEQELEVISNGLQQLKRQLKVPEKNGGDY